MPINYSDVPVEWKLRKHTVEGAIKRITRMLTAAHLSATAARRDVAAGTKYQQHFTDPTHTQLAAVQRIITLMLNRMTQAGQHLDFHYVPTLAAFTGLGFGALPAHATIANIEAFVAQRGVAAATRLRVYFCPAFFTGNVYVSTDVNTRTGTGTFLHELSHGVGNTADHAYTWQGGYAGLTAAQRATNADSYRAYCQSFDVLTTGTQAPATGGAVTCNVCHANFTNSVLLRVHKIQAHH